jgi:diadenosine tetraphosphate (Ap4A) HIT family hydrolase
MGAFSAWRRKTKIARRISSRSAANTPVILNRYPYTSGRLMVVLFDHKPNLEGLDTQTAPK